jgi:NAD(P)-dependent dehydrogenase (short-subunit alcohol dehydrogenase family)
MMCAEKVAVVTGAAGKGMGRSIALTLAREGAKVVVNYRTSEKSANEIVSHIQARGGEAAAVRADVFTEEGCRELVDAATARLGKIDICVINPGAGWNPGPIEKIDPKDSVNDVLREVAPIFHLLPLVLPGMYERKWGRIIGLGLRPPFLPGTAYSYGVGKAARANALLWPGEELWKHGVTVNVVSPGPVPAVPTLEKAAEQCDHGKAWDDRTAAQPQDVAEAVAFLCSDAGDFISGCEVPLMG